MKNLLFIFVLFLTLNVNAENTDVPLFYVVNEGKGFVTTMVGDETFTDPYNECVPKRVILLYNDCTKTRPDSLVFLEKNEYVTYNILNIFNEDNGSQTYEISNKDGKGYVNLTIKDVNSTFIYVSYIRGEKQYSWSGVIN
jgi:hypothetical protein